MVTFSKHKWWILTAVLTAPLVALAAGVPNMFSPNTVISSAAVNANFSNLSDRVTALETAIATKPSATTVKVVLDNVAGPIGTGKMGTVTTTGGPLVIMVSGAGYLPTGMVGLLDLAVQFDGGALGDVKGYTNESLSHKSLPTRAFVVPAAMAAAGSHIIGLTATTPLVTDPNDYFSVTVIELGH